MQRIIIFVKDGCVIAVSNLPKGYDFEVVEN